MLQNITNDKAYPKIIKKVIIAVVVIFSIFFIALNLLNYMNGLTACSRLETLNANAKDVYQCADKYISSENIEDNFVITGYGFNMTQDNYYWDVIIENKKIKYTLFSHNKIIENEIVVPDKETQIMVLSNIFTDIYAIGYYSPTQEKSNNN